MDPRTPASLDDLVRRAGELVRSAPGRRAVVGVCGPPGVGKSTVAGALVAAYGEAAVVLPMDGFHLPDEELARLGLADVKGAPETFDVGGYVALLRRIWAESAATVYAPAFDRSRELAVAGAVAIRPEHRLVVTEGNYLLLDRPGWSGVAPLLDECWYVDLDDAVRRERLVDRHVRHGRSRDRAEAWVDRSDEANARLVAATRAAATGVLVHR